MTFPKATAAALGLGLIFVGGAVASPKNKHDGTWQVQMVTDSGICGSSYTYAMAVEQGSVRHLGSPGEAPAAVNGQIASNGAVNLDIRRSSAKVDAAGRLSGQSGSGTWKLDRYGCSGRWNAQKRSSVAQS
jgi:hypothetical protein